MDKEIDKKYIKATLERNNVDYEAIKKVKINPRRVVALDKDNNVLYEKIFDWGD